MNCNAADIRCVIADILEVPADKLSNTTGIGDLPEWDSLAHMAIITTLEDELGLHIPEEQILTLNSVGEIVAFVHKNQLTEDTTHEKPPTDTKSTILNSSPGASYREASVVQTILQRAEETPAKAALIFEHDTLTYRQLSQSIRHAASALRARGVHAGDAIALFAERTKSFFSCYLGVHLLGGVSVVLDPDIKDEALQYIIERTKPAYIVGSGEKASITYDSLLVREVSASEDYMMPPLDRVADIMFTTGTTGKPKGVQLTHANIAAAAHHINTFIGTNSKDVEVLALPICRSFGLGRARCVLVQGGTLVLAPGFSNPQKLFNIIHDYQATGLAMVPAGWAYLHRMSGDKLAEYATHLRYMEFGSAAMPMETKQHLMRLFPNVRLCMHYGLTEASRSTFIEFHSESTHLESVGKPSPGVEVCICREDGSPAPSGTEGEICIWGHHVMKGYLNESSPTAFHGNYFRSGDWGMMDQDGYIFIRSRMKDIINVGGKKVNPEEVENILNSIAGISECACVPAPDPQGVLGEVVKAVLVQDAGANKPTNDQVRSAVATQLESYKVPAIIVWQDSLPRTDSGKLQRQLIK